MAAIFEDELDEWEKEQSKTKNKKLKYMKPCDNCGFYFNEDIKKCPNCKWKEDGNI